MIPNDKTTDDVANKVIAYVCGQSAFANCCATGGRWSLACVQVGADYAKQFKWYNGDYCGRYAWTQGPITINNTSTKQYYPRDFNLFTLNGDVSALTDVGGPVGAQGNLTASSFAVNGAQPEPAALVAQGSITLNVGGTVYGNVYYGNKFTDTNSVTYVNGTRPTAASKPIDFAGASTKLLSMSSQLALYTAPLVSKPIGSSTITFSGNDPELNVFRISSSDLTGTTTFKFSVPKDSAVIINVSGTSAAFMNAGFSGLSSSSLQSVLWNFPNATTLKIQSVYFLGSILAPTADATVQWGGINGSVVVKSAVANAELYWTPYHVPGCTGCLCRDSKWSCSSDTALDDTAHAAGLAAEAGFLQIDGGDYTAQNTITNSLETRTSPTHRIWYAFQPALTTPKSKPLAVIFNGGPGGATSNALFAFNTAGITLDPATGATYAVNPNNWGQFANLLYVDAPVTGFSYPLPVNGVRPGISMDMDRDASTFLRVIVQFLARHPALQNNRVILVGESYGGIRANLMLHYLFDYPNLQSPGSFYQDAQLAADLDGYFLAALGKHSPIASEIASKFGHQVLIEPLVLGSRQKLTLSSSCDVTCKTCDKYNCDKLSGWTDSQLNKARDNLNTFPALNVALGVDATTIKWMYSTERSEAYGRGDGSSSDDMVKAFGALSNADDRYFVGLNSNMFSREPGVRGWEGDDKAAIDLGKAFGVNVLNGVATFITVAKYDWKIWSPGISDGLNAIALDQDYVSGASYSETATHAPYTNLSLPGLLTISYQAQRSSVPMYVSMPTAYESGHTVTMRAPGPLLADVMKWYADSPH
jgi:choice-of-anchor A domain-containing protein